MSWNVALGILSVIGLLMFLAGRWMMIHEARSFSMGWVLAIRFLPLADLMFLARFWESAKTGAFVSIGGLVLMMPMGGKALWDRKHPAPRPVAKLSTFELEGRMNLYTDMLEEREAEIARKRSRLEQLHARMSGWYEGLQERQKQIGSATPEQVAALTEEAAAYSSLHKITRQLSDELVRLNVRPQLSEITVEQFDAFSEKRSRALSGVLPLATH